MTTSEFKPMKTAIDQFLDQLLAHDYRVDDPRPRFAPPVEQALEAEAEEEARHGEAGPDAVPDLPPNVRLLSRADRHRLVYVLESALDNGFWGVSADVVTELKQQPLPWALVLLQAQATRGYWFGADDVLKRVGTEWQPIVPGGPRYEVREPIPAGPEHAFASVDEFVARLQAAEPRA